MNRNKRLWGGLLLLVLLSPLGLILPAAFRSGPAWGEWSPGEIEKMIGFIPEGLKKWTHLWSAPFPEYHAGTGEKIGLLHSSLGYILSGLLGVGAVVGVALLLGRFLGKKDARGRE